MASTKSPGSGLLDSFPQVDDLTIGFKATTDYWLDIAEMEKLKENSSIEELAMALAEYRGELLPGFYDEWVASEREHLHAVFDQYMARLMSRLEEEKCWTDVLDWGEGWIKLGQRPEPAYRALMSAHAANGNMSKTAAAYERCVRSLRGLGVEPAEETKELFANLKKRKASSNATSHNSKQILKETNSTIPIPLTSFIGRERELIEISRLLDKSRLLTLTGPGGVGKTRLAIQAANRSTSAQCPRSH